MSQCPFCCSIDIAWIGTIQQSPQINAIKCNNCKIGFADRQPSGEYLMDYYKEYYEYSNKGTTIESKRLSKHIIRQIGKLPYSENYSILDYGGGDGSVSLILGEFLIDKGLAGKISIVNVDLFHKFNNTRSREITVEHLQSLDELTSDRRFDLVIASAIFEHVKEPRKVSFQLLGLLNPLGKIYFRTPYIFPFFRTLKNFGIGIDIQYPGHLFDMGNLFWSSFLSNLNLNNDFQLEKSHTSLVETQFKDEPIKATLSFLLKLPSTIIKNRYHFVGGWEVIILRNH